MHPDRAFPLVTVAAAITLGGHAGRAQDSLGLRWPQNKPCDLPKLLGTLRISGQVVDDSSGWPAAGAFVTLRQTACSEMLSGNGRFEMDVPSPGSYELRVEPAGSTIFPPQTLIFVVNADGHVSPMPLRATPAPCQRGDGGVRLQGVVHSSKDRKPIDGAHIEVEGTGCRAVTDSLGRWAILGVPRRNIRVSILFMGYRRRVVRLTLGPRERAAQSITVALSPF